MSNDLALPETTPGLGSNLPAKMEYAKTLAASGLLPKEFASNPGNLLWAIEYAEMLGLPPMVAITGINVIGGRPSMSASLMATAVRKAGHTLRTERIENGARSTLWRGDDPDHPHVQEFTLEDAKTADLLKNDNWRKRPMVMCEWRSISAVVRMAASEALFGVVHTPEELQEEMTADGAHVITKAKPARSRSLREASGRTIARPDSGTVVYDQRDATGTEDPADGPIPLVEFQGLLLAATTDQELRYLWARTADVEPDLRETARGMVKDRREDLAEQGADQ